MFSDRKKGNYLSVLLCICMCMHAVRSGGVGVMAGKVRAWANAPMHAPVRCECVGSVDVLAGIGPMSSIDTLPAQACKSLLQLSSHLRCIPLLGGHVDLGSEQTSSFA
jgi:hypothetical protein